MNEYLNWKICTIEQGEKNNLHAKKLLKGKYAKVEKKLPGNFLKAKQMT